MLFLGYKNWESETVKKVSNGQTEKNNNCN